MSLTKDKIKRWYLILALINLIVTTSCFFIFSQDSKSELGNLVGANIMFHFMYGAAFISRWQFRKMLLIGRLQNFSLFVARMFSVFFIVAGPLMSAFILIASIVMKQPDTAIVFFAPMGLFIGGLGLMRFIIDELDNK